MRKGYRSRPRANHETRFGHYRRSMAVTAKLVPDRIELLPNTPTTLTLRLYNGDDVRREA